ncbi:MAG: CinA-like protein [Herpetosiphonaceae bacterium]|nr:MAG: CinA-like protein [Herpetosiphonaceae bacterium]
MDAEIIAVGTELLLGATVDTNSAWLATALAPIGVVIRRITLVGDDEEAIASAVATAIERVPLVICSGGLGPTADDLTREGIARALGRPLELRPELLAQIEERFRAYGRRMNESNRQQAYIPSGARAITNPHGTAPAFLVEHDGRTVVALPGMPAELRYLVEHALIPYLRDERGLRSCLLTRSIHLSGTTESAAGELIADLMRLANPRVGITAKGGQYEVRIAATAESRAEAEALLASVEAQLRERLAAYITEGGRLAEYVARLLQERGLTLALYEGHREAPVYRAFGPAFDRSPVLRGVIIHPLDYPLDGEGAMSLARGAAFDARQRWQADLALAVQATPPDAAGFADVCYFLALPDGERSVQRRIDLGTADGWAIAGSVGLDFLRRAL